MNCPPTNVIFLISDQHQAGLLGCETAGQVHTPNLDAIAAQGTRFTSAYCQNPICTPSRVSFLSGQYPHNHGYYGLSGPAPARLPSFLGHFRRNGYITGAIGKLHLPDDPRDWIEPDVDFYRNCYRTVDGLPGRSAYYEELEALGLRTLEDSRMLPEHPTFSAHDARPSRMPLEHCVESWCARQAISLIDHSRSQGKPFCMEVAFPRPHHQLTPDPVFWNLYPEEIPLPPTLTADSSHRPPHFQRAVRSLKSQSWLFEPKTFEAGCRRVWRGYLACISQVDWAVGRIMRHLEASGLAENTIVVYTSDHGAYHGAFGVPEKAPGICSEAVCRIPMIWRVPRVTTGGRTVSHFVESVDVAPTLSHLCRLPEMRTSDGTNISSLLAGDNKPVKQLAVTENPWSRAIRWSNWRLVHYPSGMFGESEVCELYDLDKDPCETRNLAADANHLSVVAEGRRLLLDWLIKTSRPITVHPSYGDTSPGKHRYDLAEDGRESTSAGPRLRQEQGHLDYL